MSNIRIPVLLTLMVLSALVVVPSVLAAPSTSQNPFINGQAHLVGSVNVKDLPLQSHPAQSAPRDHSKDAAKLAEGKNIVQSPGFVPPGEASKTVLTGPTNTQPLTTNLGLTLEGAPGAAPNPCGCTPPDPNNAVGPNHVFEMVNLAGIIYSKTGTLVKPTFGLDTFFNLPASSESDPEIMYDASSGRWFASIVNIPAGSVQFAVSTSNDPTGTFLLYSVTATNALTDQPFIGTNDDKFVISVNDFNTAGTRYLGVQYWVLNKSQLVAGASTINFVTTTPDSTMFSLHPARHLSSSTTFYLVTNCTGSCVPSPTSTTTTATIVALTGVPPGTLSKTTSSFSIATDVIPPAAQQPGGVTLNTNDNRILSATWESGTLSFSSHDACIPAGDTTTRSCSRIVQATTAGPTKTQDFDYALSGGYTFYPAISTSQGQLALVYGASSTTLFPSLFVTGRASSDPVNTLQAPATVRSGTAADTSTRYGDYFGAGTDPTPTSTSTFWLSGEYGSSSASSWVTAIAQVGSFGPTTTTFDFSVSVSPSSDSVVQGNSKTATVTVSLVSGTSQPVSLTTSVPPAATGLTATVNPTSGTPTFSSTLTVSAAANTPTGTYTVTITGTSGSLSHSTPYSITVSAPVTGDFSISASPSSLTMPRTGSTSTTIMISSLSGFSGTVSLSTGPLPTGVGASFNPASVTVASGGTGTSTLTFTGGGGQTPTGTFTVTITGVSGGLTHSTTITLHITKH